MAITYKCEICSKDKTVPPSTYYRKSLARFCSYACKGISQIGVLREQSVRDKISLGHKGIKTWNTGLKKENSESLRRIGKAASLFHKGKTLSIEHRLKLSKANKLKPSWNWKGGVEKVNKVIRKSVEYKLWRESVYKRDNFTCQKCKVTGGKLHPHHILNFSQHENKRFLLNNGITLCEKCHKIFHKTFGQTNNNPYQIREFFKPLISL